MYKKQCAAAALCALATTVIFATPAGAQTTEVKEKPPLYTYVANWSFPRAKWGDVAKNDTTTVKDFDNGMSSGGLVAYGLDENLVHAPDGMTHDSFFSSMSMAGVLNVLADLMKPGTTSAVMASATKHSDGFYVSRYYNWKAGSWKGAYTHTASYKLKPGVPDDAVDTLSTSFMVPILEKLLAAGTISEYEIDEEAIHTESPDMFWVTYITPTAEGLDKAQAAIGSGLKSNPLAGPASDSLIDFTAHRDYLSRTAATYK